MTVKRRKKHTRAHNTHGWGRNKHRKSGSRGGYGMAGTGKKAETLKTKIWREDYFGKHGFVCKTSKQEKAITLKDIEDKTPLWLKQKKIKEEAGSIVIDLKILGYNKLLGTGKLTRKTKIIVPKAVPRAAEKIKAAGGELVTK
ncbi:50S ribosomal protein L15 [Candidatus Woesearchaeota archaeon]|nr:50S ribosomal protein L15 [Candidatus Woesearchaeota archaeon]